MKKECDRPHHKPRSHIALRAWLEAALPQYHPKARDKPVPESPGFPRHPKIVHAEMEMLYEVFCGVAGWITREEAWYLLAPEVSAWQELRMREIKSALIGLTDSEEQGVPGSSFQGHAGAARRTIIEAASDLADLAELNVLQSSRDGHHRRLCEQYRETGDERACLASAFTVFADDPDRDRQVAVAQAYWRFWDDWADNPEIDCTPELVPLDGPIGTR